MTVNHFAVTADQAGNLETEFPNTAAHAIHSRVVLSWIAFISDQFVDWPNLDFHGYVSSHYLAPISSWQSHTRTPRTSAAWFRRPGLDFVHPHAILQPTQRGARG